MPTNLSPTPRGRRPSETRALRCSSRKSRAAQIYQSASKFRREGALRRLATDADLDLQESMDPRARPVVDGAVGRRVLRHGRRVQEPPQMEPQPGDAELAQSLTDGRRVSPIAQDGVELGAPEGRGAARLSIHMRDPPQGLPRARAASIVSGAVRIAALNASPAAAALPKAVTAASVSRSEPLATSQGGATLEKSHRRNRTRPCVTGGATPPRRRTPRPPRAPKLYRRTPPRRPGPRPSPRRSPAALGDAGRGDAD